MSYTTSKTHCTCKGFRYKRACKHVNILRKASGLPTLKSRKAHKNPRNFIHMKFHWVTPDRIKGKQWYMSRKLDGIFTRWDPMSKQFLTSSGQPFPVPPKFYKVMPNHPLDMELYAGVNKRASNLNPIVQSPELDEKLWTPNVKLVAFDVPMEGEPFYKRLAQLVYSSKQCGFDVVQYLPIGDNMVLLTDTLDKVQQQGGEGLVLKEHRNKYISQKRSKTSLKIKPRFVSSVRIRSIKSGKKGWTVAIADELNMPMNPSFNIKIPPKENGVYKEGQMVNIEFYERTPSGTPENATIQHN